MADPKDCVKKWLGDRPQVEGAKELGVSQQTVSALLNGWEPGLQLKINLKRKVGIPLGSWPSTEILTDDDLRDEHPGEGAAEGGTAA